MKKILVGILAGFLFSTLTPTGVAALSSTNILERVCDSSGCWTNVLWSRIILDTYYPPDKPTNIVFPGPVPFPWPMGTNEWPTNAPLPPVTIGPVSIPQNPSINFDWPRKWPTSGDVRFDNPEKVGSSPGGVHWKQGIGGKSIVRFQAFAEDRTPIEWADFVSPGYIIGNYTTICLEFDPMLAYLQTNWPVFSITAFNPNNNTYSTNTAYMRAGSSIGAWTFKMLDYTNTLVITNGAYATYAGLPYQPFTLYPRVLPYGVNASFSGDMSVEVTGVTNLSEAYILEYKDSIGDNECNWTTILTQLPEDGRTTNGVMTISFNSSGRTNMFLRVRSSQGCSDVVGFYTIVAPANKSVLLANQLMPPDFRIPALFQCLTSSRSAWVKKFDIQANRWVTNNCYYSNGREHWSDESMSLLPGEGLFYHNSGQSSVTITFAGRVLSGNFGRPIWENEVVLSYPLPMNTGLTLSPGNRVSDVGFPGEIGDSVGIYNPNSDEYYMFYMTNFVSSCTSTTSLPGFPTTNATTYTTNTGWYPYTPALKLGEAYIVNKIGTNRCYWNICYRTFEPRIVGQYVPDIYNYMYDDVFTCGRQTWPWNTNYLLIQGQTEDCVDVQFSPNMTTWYTASTLTIDRGGSAVVEIPTQEEWSSCFFRAVTNGYQAEQQMMQVPIAQTSALVSTSLRTPTSISSEKTRKPSKAYYSLSRPDRPPLPGNPRKLPEYTYDASTVFMDDTKDTKTIGDNKITEMIRAQQALPLRVSAKQR